MELAGWLTENRRRATIALVLFVLAGVPLYVAFKAKSWATGPRLLAVGSSAPTLQGPTMAGDRIDTSLYGGRVLVYVFVDPMLESASRLGQAVQVWNQRWADNRAVVFPVLMGDDTERQRQWVARFGLNPNRIVIDRQGTRAELFRVFQAPTVYVVDGQGRVRYAAAKIIGSEDPELNAIVTKYLPAPTRRFKRTPP